MASTAICRIFICAIIRFKFVKIGSIRIEIRDKKTRKGKDSLILVSLKIKKFKNITKDKANVISSNNLGILDTIKYHNSCLVISVSSIWNFFLKKFFLPKRIIILNPSKVDLTTLTSSASKFLTIPPINLILLLVKK